MADLKAITDQALQLAPEARASLVDTLLESLDATSSEAATQAWFEEVLRRRKEVAEGAVELIPGDDLFRGLD
jgi:hypothetical protein